MNAARTALAATVGRVLPGQSAARPLAVGQLITSAGNGAWYSTWAIFLTSSAGLPVVDVGVGLTIAGILGMLVSAPVGRLADRLGPREVLIALATMQGVAMAGYTQVHGLWTFLTVACVSTMAQRGTAGVLGALVTGITPPERRLRELANVRVMTHVGFTAGAALGTVVLAVNTRWVYVAMVLFNAATYLALAAGAWRVPGVRHAPGRERSRRVRVTRDAPYLTLALLSGVMALNWGMLSTGVPLWIVHHTRASPALAAVITFANSIGIALLQVRASRGTERPRRAARVLAVAGAALALSCALFASTFGRGGPMAVALFLAGGLALLAGETLWSAGSFGVSVAFMPEDAQGEYQSVFATGAAAAQMAAPAVMTALLVEWGLPGWYVLAALFLLSGAAALPATGWALRTRPLTVPGSAPPS